MGASEKVAATFGTDIADRDSALVQTGLGRYCRICHAAPGFDCTNPVDGGPLAGRIVHYERASGSVR